MPYCNMTCKWPEFILIQYKFSFFFSSNCLVKKKVSLMGIRVDANKKHNLPNTAFVQEDKC